MKLDGLHDRVLRVLRGADLVPFQPEHFRERLDRIGIVVDDEDSPARPGTGVRAARRATRPRRGLIAWQADLERAALATPWTARTHAAAVELDDAPDERQADAEATLGVRQRTIALRERVERALQQLGLHPLSAVDDPHRGQRAVLRGFDPDFAAVGGVFRGIVQ